MRRFFSFRSLVSPSPDDTNNNNPPESDAENAHWEKPKQNVVEDALAQSSEASSSSSVESCVRRTPSRSTNAARSVSRSLSCSGNCSNDTAQYGTHSNSSTPKKMHKSRTDNPMTIQSPPECEQFSSRRSNNYSGSSRKSPSSSPIPPRSRSSRLTKASRANSFTNLHIDSEEIEMRDKYRKLFSVFDENGYNEEHNMASSRRPPRARSLTASPNHNKENLRSSSFRENWDINQSRFASPRHQRCELNSREYDSEATTTTHDIFEDYAYQQPSLSSDDFNRKARKVSSKSSSSHTEDDTDRELAAKLEEVEEKYQSIARIDVESDNLRVSQLRRMIKEINEDRKSLAMELVMTIRGQIEERSFAKDALVRAKLDLDMRTRRLEKENNELQFNLESELDKRSTDWSLKLKRFQIEEQRLRERVRELAEQNVHLQREVSSYKSIEEQSRCSYENLERQFNDLEAKLEEVSVENESLRGSSLEWEMRFKSSESNRDSIARSYKEKESENKDFRKAIVRLQRTCDEQENTIAGLRKELSGSFDNNPSERGLEITRLTGVEMALRKEVESCNHEVESLKSENICLLDRLKNSKDGCGPSMFRLHQELEAQVEILRKKGLLLLNDNIKLSRDLFGLVENKQFEYGREVHCENEKYNLQVEHKLKFHSLEEGIRNLKRNLQSVSMLLDDKSRLESLTYETQSEFDQSEDLGKKTSTDDMEHELKEERLLARVLKEKLYYKEQELEKLQGELASSVRSAEVSRAEIQTLKDEISNLLSGIKDRDLQMLEKDEDFDRLKRHFEECKRELSSNQSVLSKISEERDCLWDEFTQSKETNMLLNDEVKSLKNKVDGLEEENLLKEGQITILRDSISKKSLCSPKLMKLYALE